MTAAPIPLRAALDRGRDGGDDARVADDRRAVLRELVDRALGPLATRATATVPEVADVLGVSTGSVYEAVRAGSVSSLRIGRRVVVPVPALAAMLLGVDARPDEIP